MEQAIKTLVDRLEAVTQRLESVESQLKGGASCSSAPSSGSAGASAGASWVGEYQTMKDTHITKLVSLTEKIGNNELKAQVAAFASAINNQLSFLNTASNCAKPSDAVLGKLLESTSKDVASTISIRDSARGNALWNHLSALSEAVPALGWVAVSPTPGPFVKEYKGNSEFYLNKLLVSHKGDENQMGWINSVKEFFAELIEFIRKHHTTGLSWKNGGADASTFVGAAPAAAAAVAPKPAAAAAKPAAAPAVGAALFSELNKGTAISSGLKKVTNDMKTKNRDPNEKSAVVKAPTSSAPSRAKPVKRGTPKFALEGNKWVCEFQDDAKNLCIEESEPKHTVYLYKNDNTVLNIKGQKINSICIDSCNKCGVVFNNAIAVVEIVNCNGLEIQCQGKVPAFAIDKCSSIQVILSKDCLDAEIVTSKSDQVNILIPDGENDLIEMAVPEQYKTTIVDGKLVTGCVEHV